MQPPTLTSSLISFGLGILFMPSNNDLHQCGRKILARYLKSPSRQESNQYQSVLKQAGAVSYLAALLFLMFIEKKVITRFNAGLFAILPLVQETKALLFDPEKKELERPMVAILLTSNALVMTNMALAWFKE